MFSIKKDKFSDVLDNKKEKIDLNKRNFIKKSILGLAGFGSVVAFSKLTKAWSILGFGDGTTQTTAASRGILTGTIIDYAGTSAPAGYLNCDGSNIGRTTYAPLFNAIGTTWGVGDGSTTFNLPDLRRHITMGSGGTAVSGPLNTIGSTGGAETHTLTTSEMPSHSHSTTPLTGLTSSGSTGFLDGSGQGNRTSQGSATGNTGGSQPHNIMQPYIALLYCVKN